MLAFLSRAIVVATLAASVLASSVDCIVKDLTAIEKKTERLDLAVSEFHHRHGCFSPCHDLKPLAHIYSLSCELDQLLEDTIDDVQTACDFSEQGSQKVLTALAAIEGPLSKTLDAFKSKVCDFRNAIGPHLSHSIVGGTLVRTRFLTLNLLRSITCKAEPEYSTILDTVSEGIAEQFDAVIAKY